MQRNFIQGSEFLLYDINDVPVAYSTNCVLKINQNLSDVTHKDSQSWAEYMVGLKAWSITFDGLVSYGEGFNTSFFVSKYNNSEPFFVKFGIVQDSFTHAFSGEVQIESIEQAADHADIATYSGSLKGVGSLSFVDEGSPIQNGYLKVEEDPIFRGSPAYNITNDDKTKWNEASNKIVNQLSFTTVGDITTLNIIFKDGTTYSSAFTQSASSPSVDLSNYYTKQQSDSKYLTSASFGNYYTKTQTDSMYLVAEADTLSTVTSRGNSTTNNISFDGVTTISKQLNIPLTKSTGVSSGAIWIGDGSTAGQVIGASESPLTFSLPLTRTGDNVSLNGYNNSNWDTAYSWNNHSGKYLNVWNNLTLDGNTDNLQGGGKVFNATNIVYNYGSFLSFGQGQYTTQFNGNSNKDGQIAVRVNGDGGYGTWQNIYHTGNFNPANYLPLTGGTLTGVINTYAGISLNGAYVNFGNNFAIGYNSTYDGLNLFKYGVLDGVLFVKNNLNIGIGTINPTEKLDVTGNGLFSGTVTASSFTSNSGAAVYAMQINQSTFTAGNQKFGGVRWVGANAAQTANIGTRTDVGGVEYLGFGTLVDDQVVINQDGKLGIGTVSPTEKLHVTGNGKFSGSVTSTTFYGEVRAQTESQFSTGTFTDPRSGYAHAIKVGGGGIAVTGDSYFNNTVTASSFIGNALSMQTVNKIGVHLTYANAAPTISLAIGDNDTGFNAVQDGVTAYVSNGVTKYNLNNVYHTGNIIPAQFFGRYGDGTYYDINNDKAFGSRGMGSGNSNSPLNYGSVFTVPNMDTGLQIAGGYNYDNFFFRGWGPSGFTPWRTVWHNGNLTQSIGSAPLTVVQRDASGRIAFDTSNVGLNFAVGGDLASIYYDAPGNGSGKLIVEVGDDNAASQGVLFRTKYYTGAVTNLAYIGADGTSTFYGKLTANNLIIPTSKPSGVVSGSLWIA